MTHREARQKLGSRSRRRANTNGKNMGKGKRRNPRPVKQFTRLGVRRILNEARKEK